MTQPQLSSNPAATARLGIVGGGQLARMTALAAVPLGCEVVILDRQPDGPAARCATRALVGDWNDPAQLRRLAAEVDVVTLENEFVDAGALRALEADGCVVQPSAACVALVQDKFTQKSALAAAGLAVPQFRAVQSPAEVAAAAAELGWPLVLKARRDGYDGKGNFTVKGPVDIERGWQQLSGGRRELMVEAFCPFVRELAVIVTRSRNGESVVYPVVESHQRDHICHRVEAPAQVAAAVRERATATALQAVAAVGGTGSFGVEMFLTAADEVVINELAPRVHNTGHYTIEGCVCSQFENHVRAVLGWPLGATTMRAPAAVMINLLGRTAGSGRPVGAEAGMAVPGAHLHFYGKAQSGAGRKLGHVTALGPDAATARATAELAAGKIRYGLDAQS